MGAGVNEHLSKQFDAELESIRSRVLEMGGLVESQIRRAVEGFGSGERALLDDVIATDRRVNEMEVALDGACSHVIVKRQPAANDLRLIFAITKTVTDLERIGDEAQKIARMGKRIHEREDTNGRLTRTADVRHAAEVVLAMLRRALDAFARLDCNAAQEVIEQDALIDSEFQSLLRQLVTYMMEDPRTITTSLDVIWVAKAIERMGDHAKNMAEYVIYIVKGTDVRHISSREAAALGG
jgi:phosphate transport system protein